MAQSSQSAPTVTANIAGANHQVNLRDFLNMRVAPFLKKAITESLEASPEFPLQWLGENLIHQSMLYEGNPDSTKIKERFRYNFDEPIPTDLSAHEPVSEFPAQEQPTSMAIDPPLNVDSVSNGVAQSDDIQSREVVEDVQGLNQVNGGPEDNDHGEDKQLRDTDMEGTS